MFQGLDHPSIACRDVTRLAEWYCEHLGMRIMPATAKNRRPLIVGYDDNLIGGAVIEMMPATDPGPTSGSNSAVCPGHSTSGVPGERF